MRKKIIDQSPQGTPNGLNLIDLAQVEISSEDEAHPIEAAFTQTDGIGWKAAQPGEQTIRFLFDEPQRLERIQLLFREKEQDRAQEFVLRWLPAGEQSYRDIVRQQYNFSPPNTTEEAEDYTVNLNAVSALELKIIPDLNGRGVCASLAQLQVS